jgi:hypothetical protein
MARCIAVRHFHFNKISLYSNSPFYIPHEPCKNVNLEHAKISLSYAKGLS